MTIGQKIKTARLAKSMTQSDLVQNKITRNMLSSIERDKAKPSLETISYIAERLELPIAYFLTEEDDFWYYEKKNLIDNIVADLKEKRYKSCVELVKSISHIDDELAYILATCYYEMAVSSVKFGALRSGAEYIYECLIWCGKTAYSTDKYKSALHLYSSFVKNINSPLLEFDESAFLTSIENVMEYELYMYLKGDGQFAYTNPQYKMHIEAKRKIKERRYEEAVALLSEIEINKSKYEYNVYVMLGVYADLDNCYKQLCDFENAYRYSMKRISLLENLNT